MAQLFIWDSSKYETKITQMDDEHKKLVEIMNRLATKNYENATRDELTTVIEELSNWTIMHFEHEESYLKQINFAGLDNHKNIHKRLLFQFNQHKIAFIDSGATKISEKFFEFLNLWLSAHIQHIDMQYCPSKQKKTG